MKIQKLLVIAAIVCLLAVFVSGSAYAGPLRPIKNEFCQAVAILAADATDELIEATADVADCLVEFDDCRSGRFGRDLENCINEYNRCNRFANRDQQQACDKFREEFADIYDDTLRQSGFLNLEFRFMRWANSNVKARECLQPAIDMYLLCGGVTE